MGDDIGGLLLGMIIGAVMVGILYLASTASLQSSLSVCEGKFNPIEQDISGCFDGISRAYQLSDTIYFEQCPGGQCEVCDLMKIEQVKNVIEVETGRVVQEQEEKCIKDCCFVNCQDKYYEGTVPVLPTSPPYEVGYCTETFCEETLQQPVVVERECVEWDKCSYGQQVTQNVDCCLEWESE